MKIPDAHWVKVPRQKVVDYLLSDRPTATGPLGLVRPTDVNDPPIRHRLSVENPRSRKSQIMKELESAVLTTDLPEHGLSAGDIGTIVLVHGDAGYEVEFATLEGEPLAIVSLAADQLRAVEPGEIAHARARATSTLSSWAPSKNKLPDLYCFGQCDSAMLLSCRMHRL